MTRHERPIPSDLLRFLLAVILAVTVITALSNFGHGQELATYAGQDEHQAKLAALVPDALISIGITVLAFRHRNVWAWCCLTAGVTFLGWSGVVTALPGFCPTPSEGTCGAQAADAATRVGVALWPLLAAVLLAGVGASLLHARAPHGVTLKAPDLAKASAPKPPRRPSAPKGEPAGQRAPEAPVKPPVKPVAPDPVKAPQAAKAAPAERQATALTHLGNGLTRAATIRAVAAEYGISEGAAERDVDTARKTLRETAGATS